MLAGLEESDTAMAHAQELLEVAQKSSAGIEPGVRTRARVRHVAAELSSDVMTRAESLVGSNPVEIRTYRLFLGPLGATRVHGEPSW